MCAVKAALLGVEHPHSLAHLRTLQQLPEVAQILLWDPNGEALASVRQNQGEKVTGTFTDLAELLADPELFFVIAALRNDLGPDLFIQVMEAGKHLMAEKPIGRNAAETQQVLEAARRTGVQLGVCYQNRANPVVQEARRLVGQGLLGPLMTVEVRMLTTQVQFRDPGHWLFQREKAGGGILSWLGCHYIDLMHYIAQDDIVSVAAEVETRSGEEIDVEDVAVLSLRFRSGALGSLHVGYTLALSGGGYHNSRGYDTYFGVNGRLGRLYWTAPGAPTELYAETTHPDWADAPQRHQQFTLGASPAYGGVYGEIFIRRFIQAAQGQGTPLTRGEDALRVARVIDAAYESSRTGRRIAIAG
ncbi:Gfo/Idh/MocA family oxidoreductase [Litorilinea aerophila]|uniref:Gfo/Idh/MocA family oxidoreductase n=1 Tax=Litorilinea aerophila TaxID=1204385 RepID=A0A540VKR8_9CHLR|nr:Gfo/Idh/MocA family oxidoreductase [Litorilinea aerophila]MCC9075572.1 Gfo/Idh/MocA family oxidoreductase [Litorilinea aerophila]OUC05189.1 hypothetical protein RY27_28765 [Litorilinea aerophila]